MQAGRSAAMLVDDQILAVGEHQILALDQKTGKTGYAWFQGTQMTMTGKTGFMATGKDIVAIDRDQHAIIEEFPRIAVSDNLRLNLIPSNPKTSGENSTKTTADTRTLPIINGIEVLRSDASEIKGGMAGR